ncbi:MAG: DUF1553 domain-containing protein [Acidobacteria bacterium]|nr:DUF1553 domain-containing protein [Acidobacteriota bacterium]
MGLLQTLAAALAGVPLLAGGPAAARKNLIDEFIFSKMEKSGVPHAPIASDEEFLRRVTLDLTGRLPSPETIRAFTADKTPGKRDAYIETLFPKLPTMGIGRRPTRVGPYLDRWSTFFGDMFRNNEQLREGINSFHDYIYKALELNIPYDEFVRDMITASGVSTWTTGPANFVARHRIMAGDGYSEMNHEDTADELAIWTTRLFLGVDMECFSCHDGKGHLEKVSLWAARQKRADVWRQAAWFGKTYVAPVYGRIPEFRVNDSEKGYNLKTKSVVRLPRYPADVAPAFILNGARYDARPGENEREQYARLLTAHPQFARATVNLFWAELMGRGIVDPPFGFDMDRQDPANPPPAPWTVQPSHPELLNALAEDFRKHGHDLRHLMRTIVQSNAYQLSSYFPGDWKPAYDTYFARHATRRMSAEEFWDAVQDATGIHDSYKVKDLDRKFKYIMEASFNQDFAASHPSLWNMMQDWGQTDREDPPTDRASMVQAASLMNHELILNRVKVAKGGRLEKLLAKDNDALVDELFLATVSRKPNERERAMSLDLLSKQRERGAEDLLWALLNRADFILVQ